MGRVRAAMAARGLRKLHLFVVRGNGDAEAFFPACDFQRRDDLQMHSVWL